MAKGHTLYTVTDAAAAVGVARTTLRSAIDRDRCKCHRLSDGTPVVEMTDVRRWMASEGAKRGPKPKPRAAD